MTLALILCALTVALLTRSAVRQARVRGWNKPVHLTPRPGWAEAYRRHHLN